MLTGWCWEKRHMSIPAQGCTPVTSTQLCLIFPQAAAGSVTSLCVLLVVCSLGQALQLLVGVTEQMRCWGCCHGKSRHTSLERVALLLSSYTTFLWRMWVLWRQSWFEGCDTLVGWPLFLMWQNQVERCFYFSMLKSVLNFGRWQELKKVVWNKWCPVQKNQ